MEKKASDREKRRVTVVFWKDEYDAFVERCHSERTTPTALLNKFVRESGKAQTQN